jgi:hypothetical protein
VNTARKTIMRKNIVLLTIRRLALYVEKPTMLKKTASIEINKRMKKLKAKTKHPF